MRHPDRDALMHAAWTIMFLMFGAEALIAIQLWHMQHVFETGAIVTAWGKDGVRHFMSTWNKL